ncbi:MAG: hypothetical protein ABF586_03105 [Sporolactobacillus sp.]
MFPSILVILILFCGYRLLSIAIKGKPAAIDLLFVAKSINKEKTRAYLKINYAWMILVFGVFLIGYLLGLETSTWIWVVVTGLALLGDFLLNQYYKK